jgi:hypothetical protein
MGSYRRYFAIWMPEHTSKGCVVGVQNGKKDATKTESESRVETTLDGTRNHERDMMGFVEIEASCGCVVKSHVSDRE